MAYVGEYRERLRDGHGFYTFPSGGFRYEGEWKKGRMHGRGVFSLPDGGSYEGEFLDGEIEGIGLRRWPDGSTYNGQFRGGERYGEGVHIAASGEVYEGHWVHNERQGLGELRTVDGSVYRGDFYRHKPHGNGRIKFGADTSIYDGDWLEGKMCGRGILKSQQGLVLYEGEWFDGQRCGHGVGLSGNSTSIVYDGVWSHGKPIAETKTLAFKIVQPADLVGESDRNNETSNIIYQNAPDSITVDKKAGSRLPVLAVASLFETPADESAPIVKGESGRRVRLRLYEASSALAGDYPNPTQNLDGSAEATVTSGQCQFAIVQESPMTDAVQNPEEESTSPDTSDSAPPCEEVLADEIVIANTAGVAVFSNLAMPSQLPVGAYRLACDSLDDVEAVANIHMTLRLAE